MRIYQRTTKETEHQDFIFSQRILPRCATRLCWSWRYCWQKGWFIITRVLISSFDLALLNQHNFLVSAKHKNRKSQDMQVYQANHNLLKNREYLIIVHIDINQMSMHVITLFKFTIKEWFIGCFHRISLKQLHFMIVFTKLCTGKKWKIWKYVKLYSFADENITMV